MPNSRRFPTIPFLLHRFFDYCSIFRVVAAGLSADVHGTGPDGQIPHRIGRPLPLVAQRQEELPQRHLPQLAPRFQRRSNDVRHRHRKLHLVIPAAGRWHCTLFCLYSAVRALFGIWKNNVILYELYYNTNSL